jgi:hypothetical protein
MWQQSNSRILMANPPSPCSTLDSPPPKKRGCIVQTSVRIPTSIMYVCMYIFMYVSMYVCMHACMYVCIVCICINKYIYINIFIYLFIYISTLNKSSYPHLNPSKHSNTIYSYIYILICSYSYSYIIVICFHMYYVLMYLSYSHLFS